MVIDNERDDWKIYFPRQRTYIMKDHSWAFAAWEIERKKGNIKSDSLLFHVDYHLDDVPDGLDVPGVLTANSNDEIIKLIRTNEELYSGQPLTRKVQIDNFIWPAVARKTIGSIFTIAPQDQEDFASWILTDTSTQRRFDNPSDSQKYLDYIPISTFQKCYRTYTLEEFNQKYLSIFNKFAKEQNCKILDLDLDFFTSGNELLEEEWIRETIRYINKLCNWDLTTIALSPIYCGGKQNALKILELYLEESGLKLNESIKW